MNEVTAAECNIVAMTEKTKENKREREREKEKEKDSTVDDNDDIKVTSNKSGSRIEFDDSDSESGTSNNSNSDTNDDDGYTSNSDLSEDNVSKVDSKSGCKLVSIKQIEKLIKYNFEHFSIFDEVLYNVHRQLNSPSCDPSDSNTSFSYVRVPITGNNLSVSQLNIYKRGKRCNPLKVKFNQLYHDPTGSDFKLSYLVFVFC